MAHVSNPLRGPARSPEWARLTRLGGDRVAVLLKVLRSGLGKIATLEEQVSSDNPDAGWTIRYSIGNEPLFTLAVRPGSLECAIPVADSQTNRVSQTDDEIRTGMASLDSTAFARAELVSSKDVRSFLKLVVKRSRLLQAHGKRKQDADRES